MKNIRILAISGSLRDKSSNANVLQAARMLAPKEVDVTLYSELVNLNY